MSAKLIRRVVELVIVLFFVSGFLLIARAAAAILDGKFGTIHWPVQAGAYGLEAQLGEGAQVSFLDGNLAVAGQPFWHSIDLGFSIAIIGIFIAALVLLRGVLVSFAKGELLNTANADALRKIGVILLVACGLSVLNALLLQPAILSVVTPAEGTVLHPAISWDVKGMTNIWLHYDPPIVTFALGGLAWLFGEAIRSGANYRQDSESVV